jgi:hypothetical protein
VRILPEYDGLCARVEARLAKTQLLVDETAAIASRVRHTLETQQAELQELMERRRGWDVAV